jgi:hypothetical protein
LQLKTVARRELIDPVTKHAKRVQKGNGQMTPRRVAIPAQLVNTPTSICLAKTVLLVNTPKNDRTVANPAVLERSLAQKHPAALHV